MSESVPMVLTVPSVSEAVIQAQIKAYQDKLKQALLETEIRDRILEEQRKQPGYRYY